MLSVIIPANEGSRVLGKNISLKDPRWANFPRQVGQWLHNQDEFIGKLTMNIKDRLRMRVLSIFHCRCT